MHPIDNWLKYRPTVIILCNLYTHHEESWRVALKFENLDAASNSLSFTGSVTSVANGYHPSSYFWKFREFLNTVATETQEIRQKNNNKLDKYSNFHIPT